MQKLIGLCLLPWIGFLVYSLAQSWVLPSVSGAPLLSLWTSIGTLLGSMGVILWDGRRICWQKWPLVLPFLPFMLLLLLVLLLGHGATLLSTSVEPIQVHSMVLSFFWPCAILMLFFLGLAWRQKQSAATPKTFSPESPVRTERTDLTLDAAHPIRDFLRFAGKSLGALEAGLLYRDQSQDHWLGREAEPPHAVQKLQELDPLKLPAQEGLGHVAWLSTPEQSAFLIPFRKAKHSFLYLSYSGAKVFEGETLQKLKAYQEALVTLMARSLPGKVQVSAPWATICNNLLLGFLVLPFLLSWGLVAKGAPFLIPDLAPWSWLGVPTVLGLSAYYFLALFAWGPEQRKNSAFWHWHRAQAPKALGLVWVHKFRNLRLIGLFLSIASLAIVLQKLDQPNRIGSGFAMTFIVTAYQQFLFMVFLPARTFACQDSLPTLAREKLDSQALKRLALISRLAGMGLLMFELLSDTALRAQVISREGLGSAVFFILAFSAYILTQIPWQLFLDLVFRRGRGKPMAAEGLRPLLVYSLLGCFSLLLCLCEIVEKAFRVNLSTKSLSFLTVLSPLCLSWVSLALLFVIPLSLRLKAWEAEV